MSDPNIIGNNRVNPNRYPSLSPDSRREMARAKLPDLVLLQMMRAEDRSQIEKESFTLFDPSLGQSVTVPRHPDHIQGPAGGHKISPFDSQSPMQKSLPRSKSPILLKVAPGEFRKYGENSEASFRAQMVQEQVNGSRRVNGSKPKKPNYSSGAGRNSPGRNSPRAGRNSPGRNSPRAGRNGAISSGGNESQKVLGQRALSQDVLKSFNEKSVLAKVRNPMSNNKTVNPEFLANCGDVLEATGVIFNNNGGSSNKNPSSRKNPEEPPPASAIPGKKWVLVEDTIIKAVPTIHPSKKGVLTQDHLSRDGSHMINSLPPNKSSLATNGVMVNGKLENNNGYGTSGYRAILGSGVRSRSGVSGSSANKNDNWYSSTPSADLVGLLESMEQDMKGTTVRKKSNGNRFQEDTDKNTPANRAALRAQTALIAQRRLVEHQKPDIEASNPSLFASRGGNQMLNPVQNSQLKKKSLDKHGSIPGQYVSGLASISEKFGTIIEKKQKGGIEVNKKIKAGVMSAKQTGVGNMITNMNRAICQPKLQTDYSISATFDDDQRRRDEQEEQRRRDEQEEQRQRDEQYRKNQEAFDVLGRFECSNGEKNNTSVRRPGKSVSPSRSIRGNNKTKTSSSAGNTTNSKNEEMELMRLYMNLVEHGKNNCTAEKTSRVSSNCSSSMELGSISSVESVTNPPAWESKALYENVLSNYPTVEAVKKPMGDTLKKKPIMNTTPVNAGPLQAIIAQKDTFGYGDSSDEVTKYLDHMHIRNEWRQKHEEHNNRKYHPKIIKQGMSSSPHPDREYLKKLRQEHDDYYYNQEKKEKERLIEENKQKEEDDAKLIQFFLEQREKQRKQRMEEIEKQVENELLYHKLNSKLINGIEPPIDGKLKIMELEQQSYQEMLPSNVGIPENQQTENQEPENQKQKAVFSGWFGGWFSGSGERKASPIPKGIISVTTSKDNMTPIKNDGLSLDSSNATLMPQQTCNFEIKESFYSKSRPLKKTLKDLENERKQKESELHHYWTKTNQLKTHSKLPEKEILKHQELLLRRQVEFKEQERLLLEKEKKIQREQEEFLRQERRNKSPFSIGIKNPTIRIFNGNPSISVLQTGAQGNVFPQQPVQKNELTKVNLNQVMNAFKGGNSGVVNDSVVNGVDSSAVSSSKATELGSDVTADNRTPRDDNGNRTPRNDNSNRTPRDDNGTFNTIIPNRNPFNTIIPNRNPSISPDSRREMARCGQNPKYTSKERTSSISPSLDFREDRTLPEVGKLAKKKMGLIGVGLAPIRVSNSTRSNSPTDRRADRKVSTNDTNDRNRVSLSPNDRRFSNFFPFHTIDLGGRVSQVLRKASQQNIKDSFISSQNNASEQAKNHLKIKPLAIPQLGLPQLGLITMGLFSGDDTTAESATEKEIGVKKRGSLLSNINKRPMSIQSKEQSNVVDRTTTAGMIDNNTVTKNYRDKSIGNNRVGEAFQNAPAGKEARKLEDYQKTELEKLKQSVRDNEKGKENEKERRTEQLRNNSKGTEEIRTSKSPGFKSKSPGLTIRKSRVSSVLTGASRSPVANMRDNNQDRRSRSRSASPMTNTRSQIPTNMNTTGKRRSTSTVMASSIVGGTDSTVAPVTSEVRTSREQSSPERNKSQDSSAERRFLADKPITRDFITSLNLQRTSLSQVHGFRDYPNPTGVTGTGATGATTGTGVKKSPRNTSPRITTSVGVMPCQKANLLASLLVAQKANLKTNTGPVGGPKGKGKARSSSPSVAQLRADAMSQKNIAVGYSNATGFSIGQKTEGIAKPALIEKLDLNPEQTDGYAGAFSLFDLAKSNTNSAPKSDQHPKPLKVGLNKKISSGGKVLGLRKATDTTIRTHEEDPRVSRLFPVSAFNGKSLSEIKDSSASKPGHITTTNTDKPKKVSLKNDATRRSTSLMPMHRGNIQGKTVIKMSPRTTEFEVGSEVPVNASTAKWRSSSSAQSNIQASGSQSNTQASSSQSNAEVSKDKEPYSTRENILLKTDVDKKYVDKKETEPLVSRVSLGGNGMGNVTIAGRGVTRISLNR